MAGGRHTSGIDGGTALLMLRRRSNRNLDVGHERWPVFTIRSPPDRLCNPRTPLMMVQRVIRVVFKGSSGDDGRP
jgi:hypothetical protein